MQHSRGNPVRVGDRGYSLIEVVIVLSIFTLVIGGVTSSFWTVQASFDEQVVEADLQRTVRSAMDRITHLTKGALTSDTAYGPLDTTVTTASAKLMTAVKSTTGTESYELIEQDTTAVVAHSMRFRDVLDIVNGNPVYDDVGQYFFLAPGGPVPCDGVVLGRGPDAGSVAQYAAGPDGRLGTTDDDTAVEFVNGIPAVEMLLPAEYAPRSGTPLTFTIDPQSEGRLIMVTMRVNARRPDGSFLHEQDLVLRERVALRW